MHLCKMATAICGLLCMLQMFSITTMQFFDQKSNVILHNWMSRFCDRSITSSCANVQYHADWICINSILKLRPIRIRNSSAGDLHGRRNDGWTITWMSDSDWWNQLVLVTTHAVAVPEFFECRCITAGAPEFWLGHLFQWRWQNFSTTGTQTGPGPF